MNAFTLRNLTPLIAFFLLCSITANSQIVINEGSNKNFNTLLDEDGESEDWIELYNTADTAVQLLGYSLSDNSNSTQWIFSEYLLPAHSYLIVFCSGKNRFYDAPFHTGVTITDFTPTIGWNSHVMNDPFQWNGVDDLVINVCAYNDHEYNSNSIFNQSEVNFNACISRVNDNSDASCSSSTGDLHTTRPNIQLNGIVIGDQTIHNTNTTYPAPYGNWYWCSRHQFLYRAEELLDAGITPGPINTLAWDVVATGNDFYNSIEISFKQMQLDELDANFINSAGQYFHTNFKISAEGETISLYTPDGILVDELWIHCPIHTTSQGKYPDGNGSTELFSTPTPGASNNVSETSQGVLSAPIISVATGVYSSLQQVQLFNSDLLNASIYYTTNGDEPTPSSQLYEAGTSIPIFQSGVIRARAYLDGYTASEISSATYLLNINHITPIVAITIDNAHLYGTNGIFDNWQQDWERYAQMTYFDSTQAHHVLFHRQIAMQIDGGAGGSRSNPQHSFRVEMDKSAFSEQEVLYPLLSNRPERARYSRLYFRNGSNQWLTLPYKDACLVEAMADNTNTYYSAMRPVSVYINGQYFGLYEMREKLDKEYYEVYDQVASQSPMDVLSVSYWYNLILRATAGDAQNYYNALQSLDALDPQSATYLEEANAIFDLENMTDYIIAQSWISNYDWPYNNIKMHRSDDSQQRWRYSLIDLELSLNPNGWTSCEDNGLQHALNDGPSNDYIYPWFKSMQNTEYYHYFINRFADLMNTNYRPERLLAIENRYFNEWVMEMPKEYQRWADPWDVQSDMEDFYERHLILQEELECKSDVMFDHVQNTLDLEGQFDLTLNVLPEGAGTIRINTITPTSYPWNGIYYRGIPIELTAIANEGYTFSQWQPNPWISDTLNSYWSQALDLDAINFTALFEPTINAISNRTTSALRVYPNPTHQHLHFHNPEKAITHWMLFGSDGKLILQSENQTTQSISLNVANLTGGIYSLRITYSDGSWENKRWIKH